MLGWAFTFVGCVIAIAIGVIRRCLVVVTVSGGSMEPTLSHGDRVLVLRRSVRAVKVGQIIVVEPPAAASDQGHRSPWFIKRLVAAPGDPVPAGLLAAVGAAPGTEVPAGKLLVRGDDPRSGDSTRWGYFAGDRLLGAVIVRLAHVAHRPSAAIDPNHTL